MVAWEAMGATMMAWDLEAAMEVMETVAVSMHFILRQVHLG